MRGGVGRDACPPAELSGALGTAAGEGLLQQRFEGPVVRRRAAGYDCLLVNAARLNFFSPGYSVYCKGITGVHYSFDVHDHGGRWSVQSND